MTLVERKAVDPLVAHLKKAYQERSNRGCDCYVAAPAEGSGVIDMGACVRRKQRQEWMEWLLPSLAVVGVGAAVAMREVMVFRQSRPSLCCWISIASPEAATKAAMASVLASSRALARDAAKASASALRPFHRR